uniref:Uncharacterized protein n=1 Tax=Bionectria ochroleuca TaxID=29856 RepID=A0A0B7KJC6_BIOOC
MRLKPTDATIKSGAELMRGPGVPVSLYSRQVQSLRSISTWQNLIAGLILMGNRWNGLTAIGGYIAVAVLAVTIQILQTSNSTK